MLYVFLVDTGTMMTFEMNLALDDVTVLKRAIARACSIPEDQQVLLISGGTSLDPSMKVCTYGSGTDTCPIFLFSKCSIGSETPPCPSIGCIAETNMAKHVAECMEMPNTYQSLAIRVQLAQQFAELATKEVMVCERMVHDQRLQQQGWATVIANLEDSTRSFEQQASCSEEVFQQYLESRPTYQALLIDFNGPVSLLSKIPLLPSLLPEDCTSSEEKTEEKTLYDWLTTESSSELEILRNQCMRCFEQFTEETFIVLRKEVQEVLGNEKSSQMKEIAGLEERLFTLDHLMCQAKKVERDQIKQAQNLLQQQKRVDDYNDMSVLPDLCATHQQQLNIMLTNHQCLRDMRDKCTRAKIELSNNLHKRLQWILKIESIMYEVGNKLFIHRETLKRLRQKMETIQQIHAAPSYFARNASEVCRRRNFSGSYHKWATGISGQASELYQKEVSRRKTFNSQYSNNLVNSLFPGMEDFPPPFAIECPQPFDVHLPKIVPEDLEKLKQKVPEMADLIEIPVSEPMPQICTTSDSAFSSEVPLSHITGRSTSASLGIQPLRTENQESLSIGDYASAVNETTSLASSPFEDPTFPTTSMDVSGKHGKSPSRKKSDDSEVECKRLHLIDAAEKETFSPIEEEQNNVESDAEEFERVDDVPKSEEQFEDPCAISDKKSNSDILPRNDARTRSESDCTKTPAVGPGPKLVYPKAHSEGDATSPVEERLRSPDSLLTSQDFQQADYYIDESMPSSYTESNASGLLKGNQMVKSHHVIVAELQHQLEEKNVVIASTQGKLKMSRSNILKLRRTITALQKYIQDVQEGLKRDLLRLKEYVTTEKCIALEELAATMDEVKTLVGGIQTRIHSDKEDTVNVAVKRERENLEVILQKHQHKLEVEAQKLSDCQAEIDIYQEQIRQHQLVLDDLRQDADCKLEEFKRELCEEKDNVIKSMMLEHELEMENIKDQAKRKVQEKEDTLTELQEFLAEKDAQIQKLLSERESREAEQEEKTRKVQEVLTSTLEAAFQQRQEAAVKWALEQQTEVHQEEIRKLNEEKELLRKEGELLEKQYEAKINSVKVELEENLKQNLMEQEQKCQLEKESELQKMQETLGAYKEEIESMQSHFKNAYSTTSMERMPSDSSLENLHLEKDVIHIATHEKALSQLQEKFEGEKVQLVETERKKSEEDVLEAVRAERKNHETKMVEVIRKMQSEHEEQIEQIKTCYGAEKQIAFNEAIKKVTVEKDGLIEELRAFIISIDTHQSTIESSLNQTVQDICDAGEQLISSSSDSASEEKIVVDRTLADKLSGAMNRIKILRSQIVIPSLATIVPLPVPGDTVDKRTIELGIILGEKEAEIQRLLSEKLCREAELEEKMMKQQNLLCNTLEASFQLRQKAAVNWALDQQMQAHQAEIKKIKEEQELLKENFQLQLSCLEEEHETKLCYFKQKCEVNMKQSLMEQELKCQHEKESEVETMKEALGAQCKEEIESMRSRFKYAYSTTSMERMPSDSSLENLHLEKDVIHIAAHEKALSQLQEKFEAEKAQIIATAVEAEREKSQGAILEALSAEKHKHDNEVTELRNRLWSEYEEHIERLKIQHSAEKQVSFNEVINRVTREKDGLIDEMRFLLVSKEIQQRAIKSLLDQLVQDICSVSEELSSSSSDSVSDEKTMVDRTVADRLAEAVHRVKEIRNQIDLSSSTVLGPLSASSDTSEKRFSEMEMELKKKKDELAKMKMKIMKLSVSGTFQDLPQLDKVSVLTCNVGDLVLLCYEEKHENYVVFYFGPVPHFLHTDSLELLDLKIPPDEPRKAWALVEVLEKEYCQAKKIDNRYKVPYGSRFYRVKVKFWDREAAIRRYNQRRLTSSVSSECPKPSTSGSLSDDVPPKGGPMSSSTI